MSELYAIRHPGRDPEDVLMEYIRRHPGCTRTQIEKGVPSVSNSTYHLRKMIRNGEIRTCGEGPRRYEVIP